MIRLLFQYSIVLLLLAACSDPEQSKNSVANSDPWLNHGDSATYVGMSTCRQCHGQIYESFIKTGMGKSFDHATRQKSSGDFTSARVSDAFADFYYQSFWMNDSLFMLEYRRIKNDTVHKRLEQVNYIIGSGQHTNSHLQVVNGYVNQMPMTFYTQRKKWDLPPGFENGMNTRFSRKIGLECMTCHNAYPKFVTGSENKYTAIPVGIDCERCHGPGSIHVNARKTQVAVDTSKYVDYTIVNPAKLPIARQFDICQRCHLQGNAVLKNGHSFFDFRPGQVLSDYLSVFLPRYENADDEFIMASHADRLQQSACFIKSLPKAAGEKSLKPYKGGMTCITCHNPHVSVKETNPQVFNQACLSCHSGASVKEKHPTLSEKKTTDCVSCHMPVSGSTDIPHVSVHDHYIRKPVSKQEVGQIRRFIGLQSVNEKHPDAITRAQAYIAQFEKFSQEQFYLDSAHQILAQVKSSQLKNTTQIHLYYARHDHQALIRYISSLSEADRDKLATRASADNRDAWTAYRIAEAYTNQGDGQTALKWLNKACDLAPFQLEFRNKKAVLLATQNQLMEAVKEYRFVLSEQPGNVQALVSLGYLCMLQSDFAEALHLYQQAYKLDPDNETLLLNLAAYHLYKKDKKTARDFLTKLLKRHPGHKQANQIMMQLANGNG